MNLFVARQPIFDAGNTIYGYELLYRRTGEEEHAAPGDSERMSSDVIIQSFLEIGLDRLTGGRPGFVNFGREMLLARLYEALDPASVVIELLEDVETDAEIASACAQLVESGYTLALDDYVPGGSQDALLGLASIVKVDVLAHSLDELPALAARLKASGAIPLAERVETEQMLQTVRAAGYELVQGYYFSRPEMVSHSGSSIDTLSLLPLLNVVQDDRVPGSEVEARIRRDPSLAYKLLRIVNSAATGGRGIDSILHAINLIGRQSLFRWLSLLLTSSLASSGGTSQELVAGTLVRARLLELLAADVKVNAGALFLTGMFSNMHTLLQISVADLVDRVHFAPEVRSTLLRESGGTYLPWLELAEAYEAGSWKEVVSIAEVIGVTPGSIPGCYFQAVQWTSESLAEMQGEPAGQTAQKPA